MKKGLPNGPALAPLPNLYPSFLKRSRFSPCGAYILSESIVYEVASGLKWGNFDLGKNVVDVAWHPQDFTVCFVEYGGNGAKVYTYDENSPSIRVSLPIGLTSIEIFDKTFAETQSRNCS